MVPPTPHRSRGPRPSARWFALVCWLSIAITHRLGAAAAETPPPLRSLDDLRQAVFATGEAILDFRLEGVVAAASAGPGWVALQDATATELLELPAVPADFQPGAAVTIEGRQCRVTRGGLALQLGTGPIVEVDFHHPPLGRAGEVYLEQGMQPIRVEWFNGFSESLLTVEYQSPGLVRQPVPASRLWHRSAEGGKFLPGLEWAGYLGPAWYRLPDFSRLQAAAQGTVADFDVGVRPREENVALVFTGYLEIPVTERYRFHVSSDDGSRLFAGRPGLRAERRRDVPVAPLRMSPLAPESRAHQWVAAEGLVTHAAVKDGHLELELSRNSQSLAVTIADPSAAERVAPLQRRLEVTGVRTAAGIVVIGPGCRKFVTEKPDPEEVLTEAFGVRRLQPEEARRPYRVEIQGVVTLVVPHGMVIQDPTGGVFVHYVSESSTNQPRAGESWKVRGVTAPGDFSPVVEATSAAFVDRAELPKPVRPTWDQLASGGLDAERVELEGVVLELSNSEIRLLTRDGVVRILNYPLYNLPTLALSAERQAALVGARVRLRGVYGSSWDGSIGRVHPAQLSLGNATIAVDELPPGDPFSVPAVKASDLLLFTSRPSALTSVRLSGVLLQSKPPDYFLFDGSRGFRVAARSGPPLQPGDQVEAVGFPRLNGPSPVLLEARLRRTGASSLPVATPVAAAELPDPGLDSTLIEFEATVLSDTRRQDERALELHAGVNRFFALLPLEVGAAWPAPIERDSLLRLTGVYVSASGERALASGNPFEIRLTRPRDLVVLERGPWWTPRHTAGLVAILSGGLLLAAFWVTSLRRTVSRRSAQLAAEIREREAVEHERAMERERSRVAQDLHDELGAGLTEAGMLSSLLKSDAIPESEKRAYLDQLGTVCFTLVTGLDEIVWAVNPHYDSASDLAGYFSLFAQRFLDLAGLACRLRIDGAIPVHPLDSHRRHGTFLAFKEALNNIVRHSHATEVQLGIGVVAEELRVVLTDNGCGFDPAHRPPGSDGLNGMEERIRQLGGVCTIESAPGEGTTVTFRISLARNRP